jgi:hypothetical protein
VGAPCPRPAALDIPHLIATLRRGLSRAQAARYIGISDSQFDELVRDGRMAGAKKVDSRSV